MNFNSIEFVVFFTAVMVIYFFLPFKSRWVFLLFAGYLFYMCWKPIYILLLLSVTATTYLCAIGIEKIPVKGKKRLFFILGLFITLLPLVYFKYADFLIQAFSSHAGLLNLILPIGISFFTFKALSYLIDVYRETLKPIKNIGIYALYVSFFPQLLAGPIERPGNLVPQFYRKVDFNFERFTDGLKLMLWGYFKKLVIADNAAVIVDRVFNNVHHTDFNNGIYFIIAVFFYALQVYCDFSGYTDIAVGAAKVLGFDSMKNFDRPYLSKTLTEFWTRWHISLSSWLRDYLFLPISYAILRRTPKEKILNIKTETWAYIGGIIITMFLGGLWHGANWTFAAWGLIMGFYLFVGFITRKSKKRIRKLLAIKKSWRWYRGLQVFTTFSLVCFAWIFFRANSIADAFYIIKKLPIGLGDFFQKIFLSFNLKTISSTILHIYMELNIDTLNVIALILGIGTLGWVELLQGKGSAGLWLKKKPMVLRWGIYYILIFTILYLGFRRTAPFIYSQF
ncbi:MAG TPA: MBOAT family O-acyltransferase [Candidatus Kapabacteria bacterium]|nr:MBOAT family O-acyltransferase [Candidatus Kapabacteria bacterium]